MRVKEEQLENSRRADSSRTRDSLAREIRCDTGPGGVGAVERATADTTEGGIDGIRPTHVRLLSYRGNHSVLRPALVQPRAAELGGKDPQQDLSLAVSLLVLSRPQRSNLTSAATPLSASTRVFFHHIWRRAARAPRRNAVAWPAIASVLSTRSSMRSPRERICSTFWTMMSRTCASSACARPSSSPGGAVLYSDTSAPIAGPNEPCRLYAGGLAEEEEGSVVNYTK
jgi:hypothetical protein